MTKIYDRSEHNQGYIYTNIEEELERGIGENIN
jgi:hypothetical protein